MKKELPMLVCFVTGLLLILATFFPSDQLTSAKTQLDQWFLIAKAFAVGVGIINLSRVHGAKVSRKREGWPFSIVMFICMVGILMFGLVVGSTGHESFQKLYQMTIAPMTATMPAVLAFHIASSAYRVFRVRSLEASILLISALIVMLGNVAVGEALFADMPKISAWILDVPNAAAMRGITVSAALGGVATALRTLIGTERSYLGGGSNE